MDERSKKSLENIFKKDKDVELVYLFGSMAKKKMSFEISKFLSSK